MSGFPIAMYIFSLYFAAVLGVSGLSKVADPVRFEQALAQQGFWPTWTRSFLRVTVPCTEVVLALLLLTGWSQVLVGSAVVALFAAFLGVKIILCVNAMCEFSGGNHPSELQG